MGRTRNAIVPLTDAQRKLAADNVRLADFHSHRFRRRLPKGVASTQGDDIESDAMLGLMDAARRYDPARGFQFDTYAARRIKGQMVDGLRGRAFTGRYQLTAGNTGPAFHSINRAFLDSGGGRPVVYADTLKDHGAKADNARLDAHDEAEALIALCPVGLPRRILSLYFLDGLRMKDIGREIGISESRVSQLCKQALAEVRAKVVRAGE